MKKMNLMDVAKTAMKQFFDIDPTVTEHVLVLMFNQSILLRNELAWVVRQNVEQGRNRVIELMQPEADTAYHSAA